MATPEFWTPPDFTEPVLATPQLWTETDPALDSIIAQITAPVPPGENPRLDSFALGRLVYDYKRQHPYAPIMPQYIAASYALLVREVRDYEQRVDINHWTLYSTAKDLANLPILEPTQYMEDLGEYAFRGSCDYFQQLADAGEPLSDVRLKHLMGAYRIAQDFFRYGLDARGEKLKHVTEVIFSLLPLAGGLKFQFTHDPDGYHEILMLQRLFGDVVRESYKTHYQKALEKRNMYAALEILEMQTFMGEISAEVVEGFLSHPVFLEEDLIARHGAARKCMRLFETALTRSVYGQLDAEYEAYHERLRARFADDPDEEDEP